MRPPPVEPEPWITLNAKHKKHLRDRWKLDDPEGFQAQEARRQFWMNAKRAGRIPSVSLVVPVKNGVRDHSLAGNGPTERGSRYVARWHVGGQHKDEESRSVTAQSRSIGCREAMREACRKLLSGGYGLLMIEICPQAENLLADMAREGCLAVRVTEPDDLREKETKKVVHDFIRCGHRAGLQAHAWISIPCTT